ncbi:hypothetical protein [Clostridium thailandense]|uniref:hypothetical protein n=1 Tax=Clostridium thailandense TaxID=2794346 RepID=UPI0039894F14
MNNHVHLQLKTEDAHVGQFMGRLNSKFNEKRKRILYKKFVEDAITSQIAESK